MDDGDDVPLNLMVILWKSPGTNTDRPHPCSIHYAVTMNPGGWLANPLKSAIRSCLFDGLWVQNMRGKQETGCSQFQWEQNTTPSPTVPLQYSVIIQGRYMWWLGKCLLFPWYQNSKITLKSIFLIILPILHFAIILILCMGIFMSILCLFLQMLGKFHAYI